jgi:UDP-glucose 4-epimerase
VTGGAGFIGSHLVEGLVREGWSVRVLDDFSTGRESNLAGCLRDVEIFEGDVCDVSLVERAASGVDVIFHEAAIASVVASIEEPERCHRVNLSGTLGLLEVARRQRVRRVVFAASAAAYGDQPVSPQVETMPASCLSPYALHKLACEQYLALYARLHGLQTVALRYFNVYGPRQDPTSDYAAAIPIFIEAALAEEPVHIFGDGEQTRDFVFVKDVVRANLLAATADAERASGQVINIGSGAFTSVNDLIETIGRCVGREVQTVFEAPRAGDVLHSRADIGRARETLGYSPGTSLEGGLAATIKGFDEAGIRTKRNER